MISTIIFLEAKGIQLSMSRKGNSPDNGMIEFFFGILKSEIFYGYEKTLNHLINWNKLLNNILIITITNK